MENMAELLTPTKSAAESTLTSLQEHAYALLEENKGLILATAMGTAITLPIILRPALAKVIQSTFRPAKIESALASKTLWKTQPRDFDKSPFLKPDAHAGIRETDGKIASREMPPGPLKNPGIVLHEVPNLWKTPPINIDKRRTIDLDQKKR